jgi:hypothetical protein
MKSRSPKATIFVPTQQEGLERILSDPKLLFYGEDITVINNERLIALDLEKKPSVFYALAFPKDWELTELFNYHLLKGRATLYTLSTSSMHHCASGGYRLV